MDAFFLHPNDFHLLIDRVAQELQDAENTKREKMARRYTAIFSSLCERFWLYQDKLILDDLSFHITHPKEYKNIHKKLKKYQKKSEVIIDKVFEVIHEKMRDMGIGYTLSGRYKNLASIHKKALKKSLDDVLKLSDIFAFRIIIDGNETDCYKVLQVLHTNFDPIPEKFKDYIWVPKINGYQSLHTSLRGVISELDIPIELQIRTKQMHEIAESWIAAHFLYAHNKQSEIISDKERKLIEYYWSSGHFHRKSEFVYGVTRDGDILKCKQGSTIMDFARKIHSSLPKKIRYALVNTMRVETNYVIRNLDAIELII